MKLIRAGWKNSPYKASTRTLKPLPFPRGVWTHPKHGGPHTTAVALLCGKPINGDGKPFADAVSLSEMRRAEADRKKASAAAEREEIRAEAAARAERLKLEKDLAK